MRIRVLGSAAGGGVPQWNCACRLCDRARAHDGVTARSQDTVAVSADGRHWCLLNASPDVVGQVERHRSLQPGPGCRQTPIGAVVLTDAELDHCVGLLMLRQAVELDVYATGSVLAALTGPLPVVPVLAAYGTVRWTRLQPGCSVDVHGIRVLPFAIPRRPPRYARALGGADDWAVGLRLTDLGTGRVAVYAPSVAQWSEHLATELAQADSVLIDGTFWSDSEMASAGAGRRTSWDMGHLPIAGREGSAAHLAVLPARRKVYVHINNTNPALDARSAEAAQLAAAGIDVAVDGMEWEA